MRFEVLEKSITELLELTVESIADDYDTEVGSTFVRYKEEINRKFGSGTDGAVGFEVYVKIDKAVEVGSGNIDIDTELTKFVDDAWKEAKDLLLDDPLYAEERENLDNVESFDLVDEIRNEYLHEILDSLIEDFEVTYRVMAFYYGEDNTSPHRGYPGKNELEICINVIYPKSFRDPSDKSINIYSVSHTLVGNPLEWIQKRIENNTD